MDQILVDYLVTASAEEIESIARDIAFEQTVEVPPDFIQSEYILNNIVGTVLSLSPVEVEENRYSVRIAYNAQLANRQIPQLLNLLYGNISIKHNIFVKHIEFPDSLLRAFPGPRHGIEGLRARLGVYGRPLLCTALKPRGLAHDGLAGIAGNFARGGGDIIKDDHNLVDSSLEAFRTRVGACQAAVTEANQATGHTTLYFPNICYEHEMLAEYLDCAAKLGIEGILVSPLLIGMDTVRWIRDHYPFALMAHPTFTGTYYHSRTHGVDHGLFLGTLFRLLGVDASVFPNHGGRFGFTQDDCHRICNNLREPLGQLKSAFPAPAGGMKLHNIPAMAEEYGKDTLCLIGGALLSHGPKLAENTKIFLDAINEHFREERTTPEQVFSACEIPSTVPSAVVEFLPFIKDSHSWQGREKIQYKASQDMPFEGVERLELIGKHGEQTAFDLRYFEIEPGGYTSLEKHNHTHTVICVRGEGVLKTGETIYTLHPMDVAYIDSMKIHQLQNPNKAPFGFFCIVDHERDRPLPP
ncbi:cupin domain-containing protein [bacterium]|nr:cupin domain-containing protein [bacterium]